MYLICGPSAKIDNLRIDPDTDASVVNFDGLINPGNVTDISAFIADADGVKVVDSIAVNINDNAFSGSISALNLQKWDLQTPAIYTLNLKLLDSAGNLVKTHLQKFGYRQFKISGNRFYLNGKRIKIYFGNIKSYSPGARYFEPQSAENFKQWLLRQKAQGVNTLRYHMAGPDSEYVLNICDEAGIMVMQEFPVFHRVFSSIPDSNNLNAYLDFVLVELSDFMYRDYNHPSVVMWSLSNEVWSETLLELYGRFYDTASQIESGSRPMCPTSGLNSFGVPSVAVATDYFDDHNYDMNGWCDLATLDSISERIAQVEGIYGTIDRPWMVVEFDDVPTGSIYFNPSIGYVEQYITNKNDIRVKKIGLRAASGGDCYDSMLKYHGKRVYEMMRAEPVFQGWHPWYNNRNHLPDWFGRLAADYVVMLDPARHNLHWFKDGNADLSVIVMKDTEVQLNGTVKISLKNNAGTTVYSVSNAVQMDAFQDKWEGALHCDWAGLAAGNYTLNIEVLNSQNDILNYNYYDSKIYPAFEPIGTQMTVGFAGDASYVDILAAYCPDITWKNIASSSDLNSVNKLVILPDALPVTSSWLTHTTALRWFKVGGRLLVLEQNFDGEIQFVPGISLSTKKECRDNFADVLVRFHPAFKDLTAQEFRDWNGLDNYIINAALIPVTENAICASGGFTAVFDGRIGSGELIFSQMEAFGRLSLEPAAAAYIRNLLSYLIEQPIHSSVRVFNADVTEPPIADSWSEDFESYPIGQGNNICAPNWTNIGLPTSSAKITAAAIDGNSSCKLTDVQWTNPWLKRAAPWTQSNGDVMAKAQIAVQTLHPSWPLANHLVFGNIALGVSGKNISYKVLTSSEIGKTITAYDYFTKTDVSIEASKWYDIKIVIHKIDGTNNDTADIYYKQSDNIFWVNLAKDIQLNLDFSGFVYTVQQSYQNYIGYIDNIQAALYHEPIVGDLDANWMVNIEDYAYLANYWSQSVCAQPSWCENADINQDGAVNIADLKLLFVNWLSNL